MKPNTRKAAYYTLEGLNSFATAYFFNYLLQRLKREAAWSDFEILALCVVHGVLYVPFSWYGGRFGQQHGYFASLRVGFGGMLAAVVLAGLIPATWAQVLGMAVWTAAMCFTWPVLEALVSEHEDPDHLPARVGLYNVVWAGTAAAGVFFGGTLYRRLGPASLYWLPALVHLAQFLVLGTLKRRHDAWLATAPPVPSHAAAAAADPRKPRYFLRLAWIGNPFNYMAVNTLLAMVPAIGVKVGVSIEQVGWLMSLWYITRTLGFLVLWFWPGWHYHFGWFLAAFLTLLASFTVLLVTHTIWVLVVAQVFFGAASALLYYSALFYTMDGSDTKGAHGGIHEAFIGLGIFGGPAVSTAAVALTGRPESPAWAIGIFLAAGAALAVGIRLRQGRTRPAAASVVA